MTLEYRITPLLGVGGIKLGQLRKKVLDALTCNVNSFKKTQSSRHPTDTIHNHGFQIFYEGDEPLVSFIELSNDCGFSAIYCDIDVFSKTAIDVIKVVSETTGYNLHSTDGGYSYEIEALGISFWRNDCESKYFDTVGIEMVAEFT